MASIFTKIINGEIPCFKIDETENAIAFLDVNPLAIGHVLVVPKKEIDYIFDLEDKEFSELHIFSKRIAKAIKKAIPCIRIGTAVIGLEVPHTHIHLLPLNSLEDINFTREKLTPSKEELEEVASQIKAELSI